MRFALDHVYVLTSVVGAPMADALLDAGFVEGASNTHPGQGTANRRFFFDNLMVEFLFITDPEEAARAPADQLRLNERLAAGSPFGLCWRPDGVSDGSKPFEGHSYRPPYLPDEYEIWLAAASGEPDVPMIFYLDFVPGPGPSQQPRDRRWARQVELHVPVRFVETNDAVLLAERGGSARAGAGDGATASAPLADLRPGPGDAAGLRTAGGGISTVVVEGEPLMKIQLGPRGERASPASLDAAPHGTVDLRAAGCPLVLSW